MTDVRCLIKYSPYSIEVSNNLRRQLDIWRKATDGIGRFKLELRGDWADEFLADDPIQIRFNDLIVFEGYLDKGLPIAEGNVYRQIYEIVGRDYGQDLMNKQVDKTGDWMYKKQYADLIIADMLTKANSEITFTPSGDHKYGTAETIPEIAYTDVGDEYLIEAFRKIFEKIDYDMHVNENKALKIFPIGSIDSGITLINVEGSPNNNLLGPLKKTEFDSYDVKNYVIAKVRTNDDGWSDGNAADFAREPYNSVTNDFVTKIKGTSSIRCTKGAGDNLKLALEFPKYNYDYLPFDLVQEETVRFGWRAEATEDLKYGVDVILEDTNGRQIVYRYFLNEYNRNLWHQITLPMGKAVDLVDYNNYGHGAIKWHERETNAWQCYTDYDKTLFNWKIVKIIWLMAYEEMSNVIFVTAMVIDNLMIPFAMVSYKQDAGSEGSYKVRKRSYTPNNIRTQAELEEFAQTQLDKEKDPIYSLYARAVGSAGIIGGVLKWIPGYIVTVHSPGEGINNEQYRIAEVHSTILEEPEQGHDFIVEAELVPKEYSISGQRLGQVKDPDIALLRELSDRMRYFEKAEKIRHDYLPPMPADAASKIRVGDFSNLADTAVSWTRHYEAEDSSYDPEWVPVEDVMASKAKALKMAGAGTVKKIRFVDGPLGVIGELYFLVRLKVSDKTKAANMSLNIYDKDGANVLGNVTITPAYFPANNKYHHFAVRVELPADKQNIEFRLIVTKGADLDVYCDYGGIVPADLPLGYADVTIDLGPTNITIPSEPTNITIPTEPTDITINENTTGITAENSEIPWTLVLNKSFDNHVLQDTLTQVFTDTIGSEPLAFSHCILQVKIWRESGGACDLFWILEIAGQGWIQDSRRDTLGNEPKRDNLTLTYAFPGIAADKNVKLFLAKTGAGTTCSGLIRIWQLKKHTHTIQEPNPGHAHNSTDPGHTHTPTDPEHTHPPTDPEHGHDVTDPMHEH